MNKIFLIAMAMIGASGALAQNSTSTASDSTDQSTMEADLNFYHFTGGENILLPVIRFDHKGLHVEGRYNYEDLHTTSLWVGYNFKGGNKIEYVITPMIGGVFGQSRGIATGFELTFNFGRFELYSETEYMTDTQDAANSFGYTWTDFTYSPRDWWWVGLSAQRTRLYKTELDLQRGMVIGASKGNWEFSGYLYNLGFDDPFGILTVSFGF
jgi:hypothetical protein